MWIFAGRRRPAGNPGAGSGQRQVSLDLVAVAAVILLPDRVAGLGEVGLGEVGDGAVGAALGDAQAGRDVTQPAPGWCAIHSSTRAWVVRKPELTTP